MAPKALLDDLRDGPEDSRGQIGRAEHQARQEAPEPGKQQAAVVADGAEEGVGCGPAWNKDPV